MKTESEAVGSVGNSNNVEIVSHKGVSAKIRTVRSNKAGKEYTSYRIEYVLAGKTKQVWRTDYTEAKAHALDACKAIGNGQPEVFEISATEQLIFSRAKETASKLGIPVDTVCEKYAELVSLLPNNNITLPEIVRDWVTRNAPVKARLSVNQTAELFKVEIETDGTKPLRQKALKWTLNHLTTTFGDTLVETINPDQVSRHIKGMNVAERTKKNHRDSIGFFNRWLLLRGYLAKGTNWLDNVEDYSKTVTGEIEIYTPEEIKKLLSTSNGMTAFIALGAFAGLRHAEISRLDWKAVDLKDGWIHIGGDISKTGVRRLVPIKPNLAKWLTPVAKESGAVTPYENTVKQLLKIADDVGVTWKHNALRHSYISYRMAESADIPRVADECGNSPAMIKQHYLQRVKPEQAKQWFAVKPQKK
jgi:integrase